jgi:hypothetical protein
MDKLEVARSVDFSYPQGNWISPQGEIVRSISESEGHTDTLCRHLNITRPENDLSWKNEQVAFGYIRVLFTDACALFQTDLHSLNDAYLSRQQNHRKMLHIIQRLVPTQVHRLAARKPHPLRTRRGLAPCGWG